MKETFEADIDEKGRILIPNYFRERLGLKPGDTVKAEIEKVEDV